MRKVMIKKWIPFKYTQEEGKPSSRQHVTGTGCFEKDFNTPGLFHQWGISYEEFEAGPGNFTVGIIELKNGEIEMSIPTHVKFIS